MRDPRFVQQKFTDQLASRRQSALAIDIPKNLEGRILDAIENAWAASRGFPSEVLLRQFDEAIGSVAPQIGALVEEVRSVLAGINHGGSLPSNLTDRAGILVGKALGQSLAVMDLPSFEIYDQARSAVGITDLGAIEFDNVVLAACADSVVKCEAWVAALSAVPSDISEYLMSYQRKQEELVEGLKRESITKPAELWGGLYGRVPIDRAVLRRFSLLGRLSPMAMLHTLEAIPSVGIRHALIESMRLFEDLDLIAQGLRELPPAYDEQGNWTGRTMPFLLLGSVIEYASALFDIASRKMGAFEYELPEASPNQIDKEEVSKQLRNIAEIAFSRPVDGLRLGIEFSTELVRKTTMERGTGNIPTLDAEEIARDIWVEYLNERKCRFHDINNAISLTKSGNSNLQEEPYLLLAALLDHAQRNPDDPKSVPPEVGEPGRVWEWYVRCLVDSSSGIRNQVNSYNRTRPWVLYVLAASLAASPDVCGHWDRAWSQLYPQRQEARFKPDAWLNLDSSRHLLRVGRTLFEYRLTEKESGPDRRLWHLLCQREAQFHIGHPPLAPRTDFPEIASLLGLAGHVMGRDWGSVIDELAPLLAADGLVAVATSWLLIKNGLKVKEVHSKFISVGCDLVDIAWSNLEWRTRLGRDLSGGLNLQQFIALFHELDDSRTS